ncbi:MAG: MlaD family protein [Planctomycetales bacterium]
MTERQLQLRVGIFVVAAMSAAVGLVFQFGQLKRLWEPAYVIAVHFDSASGIHPSMPVRRSGLSIGRVSEVMFDEQHGGVLVLVEIREQFRLRSDARPFLVQSLLGDAHVEFEAGAADDFLPPGARVEGQTPLDPMDLVHRMEERVTATLASFEATSREWTKVAQQMNDLMETNHGRLDQIVERTAESLDQLALTLKSANAVLADPQQQENLRLTLEALPKMVEETRTTIAAVRTAVQSVDANLSNLEAATQPLAEHSTSIVVKLNNTLANLESVSSELDRFAKLVNHEEGAVRQFITDPQFYRNLNASAASLAVLLRNIEPAMKDLRIFSDKIARHPELMGVSGALNGSSGLKDPPDPEPTPRGAIQPAGGFAQPKR